MTEPIPAGMHRFEFIGGEPCLDFTNTVGGDRRTSTVEHLHSYADLVSWARQGELITPAQARGLLLRAEREPDAAAETLATAIDLREAMFRVFFALAEGKRPGQGDLDRINRALAASLGHRRVVQSGRGYTLGWEDSDRLDRILWPVAQSAAELIANEHRAQVKHCGLWDDGCSWLFIDSSRNGTRRWCTMDDCGNKAKARRHYARKKAQPARKSP